MASAFTGTTSTLRLLPRLAVEYDLSPSLFLYFDTTDGYRPAGFNTAGPLPQTFDVAGGSSRTVRSDLARSYEIGARWSPKRGLKLTGFMFRTDWIAVRSDQYTALGLP